MAVNPLENPEDAAGAPPNLPFLEILTEFTNKLLKQDKKVTTVGLFLDYETIDFWREKNMLHATHTQL